MTENERRDRVLGPPRRSSVFTLPTMKRSNHSKIGVAGEEQTADINAALTHLCIARSHIEQGFEHLTAEVPDDDGVEFTLTCEECGEEFDPWDVHRSLVGPHTALYSCPSCRNTIRGPEPYLRDWDDEGGSENGQLSY